MTTIPAVKRGQRFTHPYMLDMDWRPDVAAGEKYADAPHAECVVTSVQALAFYYDYVSSAEPHRGAFYNSLEAFPWDEVTLR